MRRRTQPGQRGAELPIIVDDRIGAERLDRAVGKAEADGDEGQAGGARRVGIDDRIADEGGAAAAGPRHRFAQGRRIGLAHGQGVAADHAVEPAPPAERVEQGEGQPFRLVGAEREPDALRLQRVQRRLQPVIGAGAEADMVEIIVDEERKARLDQLFGRVAGRGQPAAQQGAGAVADEVAHRFDRDLRPSQPHQGMVERGGEVRGGIGERAVEIEGDDIERVRGQGRGHGLPPAHEVWKFQHFRARGAAMTNSRPVAAIILAAGMGTRMKSDLHKVLHPLAGAPMLAHLLAAVEALSPERVVVVVGAGRDQVAPLVEGRGGSVVVQEPQLGTAHAVRQAEEALAGFAGDVLILYGDTPLVETATMRRMLARLNAPDAPVAVVVASRPADPLTYGRIIAEGDGTIVRMVEHKDASEAERAVDLCNSGLMAVRSEDLWPLLSGVENDNAAGEYYLPDIVMLAAAIGRRSAVIETDADEVAGINSRAELAEVEALWQHRRRAQAMADGIGLVAPETVWFAFDTEIGRDTIVEPNVVFGPGVRIGENARIRAFSHLEGAIVAAGAEIGPFARLRPGAEIGEKARIGNFVEVKKSRLGKGAKANHLAYLGDAEVGEGANIGAGTITCNYDGFFKYRTEIGAGAFIGSNSALVAPVKIGDGAMVGAGSVITSDVAPDALAVARGTQEAKPGRAKRFREVMQAKKDR
jgi:bifunctional UDP-N-acetylglucosamine pyrophosphorylase/glucosamine-1-phosphate N-acetyltransferase